jgi:hypothetical protein
LSEYGCIYTLKYDPYLDKTDDFIVNEAFNHHFHVQIAYSLIEEQEGKKRAYDVYISFVSLLADPRYCGTYYTSLY